MDLLRLDSSRLKGLLQADGTVFLDSSRPKSSGRGQVVLLGRRPKEGVGQVSPPASGWFSALPFSSPPSAFGVGLLFSTPEDVLILWDHRDLRAYFKHLQACLAQGMWAAGFLSYDLGPAMVEGIQLCPGTHGGVGHEQEEGLPLAWFGIYRQPLAVEVTDWICPSTVASSLESVELSFDLSPSDFTADIHRIHEYIRAGDTYQVNYTVSGSFDWPLAPFELYQALRPRQRVDYGAYVSWGRQGEAILSFSPELFLSMVDGRIWSRPMKGTMPRGQGSAEDLAMAQALQRDEKNRAENVMIVDLIRNDLGRIGRVGSVTVPELFTIEGYETVLQMVSLVMATLEPGIGLYDVFRAMFPCGSITGAPKVRTMEIIAELEARPRGIYTGTIGYLSPEGDGVFNVAIRTIEYSCGKGRLGVGAGITIGSEPQAELEETLLKGRFLTDKVRFRQDASV